MRSGANEAREYQLNRRFSVVVALVILSSQSDGAQNDLLPSIGVSPANEVVRLELLAEIPLASDLAPVPDGSGRRFVTELYSGAIRVIDGDGNLLSQPYHTLAGPQTVVGGDTAFSAIAFHPGFADAADPGFGRFYTLEPENTSAGTPDFTPDFSSSQHHHSVIYEYTVSDPAANTIGEFTRRELMRALQPGFNHNFNDFEFDQNGLIYISAGDGRNSSIERQNAQLLTNVYGKILRIDPLGLQGTPSANGQYSIPEENPFHGTGGDIAEEIFAYGLRNPYRISIDSPTGDMYIGDVGQNDIEEIDVIPNVYAANSGGQNFGWHHKEGSFLFPSLAPDPDNDGTGNGDIADANGWMDPLFEYDHQDGATVIGGHLYRGSVISSLDGMYVFADYQGNRDPEDPVPNLARLFYGDPATGEIFEFNISVGGEPLPARILSIGRDADGELYVLAPNGVFAILAETGFNGIVGDVNQDGVVFGDGTGPPESDDVTAFIAGWHTTGHTGRLNSVLNGDLNFDGTTDLYDAAILRGALIDARQSVAGLEPFFGAQVPEPSAVALAAMAACCLLYWKLPIRTSRAKVSQGSLSTKRLDSIA